MTQIREGAKAISVQNSNPNSGIATANSAVQINDIDGKFNTLSIQITGTYTGALTPQVSNGGNVWVTMSGAPLLNVGTGTNQATVPSAAVGMWQVDVASFRFFRLSANAAVTGSALVDIVNSDQTGMVGFDSAIPGGSNNIGSVNSLPTANANPGSTPVSVNSAATTNAAFSKASAGQLLFLSANNVTAAAKYIRLYNKATAPTVGTDVPMVVVTVPASASKEVTFSSVGKRFNVGIGHAITNGATATDSTAVAAGDVQLAYDYI